MSAKRPFHGDDRLGDSVKETKRRLTFTENIDGTIREWNSSDEILLMKSVRQLQVQEVVERVGKEVDPLVRDLSLPSARIEDDASSSASNDAELGIFFSAPDLGVM